MERVFCLAMIIFASFKGFGQQANQLSTSKNNIGASVYFLSQNRAVSDADISEGSTVFGTDNTSAIQNILNKAKLEPIVVYWDGKYSVTGLKVYSNTTIIAFEGCGAILRNNSDNSLLENANRSFSSYADSHISIQGGIWNGNGFNDILNPAQIHDDPKEGFLGWVSVFRFFGIENLSIKDAIIYRPRTFALHAGKVKNVFIQNVKIDVGETAPINCDGLHFDGPSENITIKDCVIRAKDDHIAFNADEAPGGDITNVMVDNIKLEGGLFGIRLLSQKRLIDKVTISNIHGITKEYWLIIDNYWQSRPKDANGNFGTIFIENINVESTGRFVSFSLNHSCANISANTECLILKNIYRNRYTEDNFPSILISGKGKTIKKLIIDGYNASDSTTKTTSHIEIDGAMVNYLSLINSTVTRDNLVNSSPLLCVRNGGSVDCLQMDNIFCKGINNIVDAQGTILQISASNIIHTNAGAGEGTFKASEYIIIPDFILTNYSGRLQTSGTGIFALTRGDGFAEYMSGNGNLINNINKIKTVVILGNSIVLHSPKADIGWYGNWGMAASIRDSDFVHLLIRDIHQKDPSVVVKFKNIADFERDFATYPLSNLDSLRNPDMLIMKISENVNDLKAPDDNFIYWYDKLIKYIDPKDKSVKVIGDGFFDKKNVNRLIKDYALKNRYSFVATADLSKDTTNTAKGKFEHKGVAAHPSDKGMRMIEEKIWDNVKDYFKK
jgi:hypothetical protein